MDSSKIIAELKFKAIRSSGPGGQNVNKVASKVVLSFDLKSSKAFSDDQLVHLQNKLRSRLTNDQILILNCDESRSQFKNKAIVIKRFFDLIAEGLLIPEIRKATKIPKSVIKKRLKDKKHHSEIKRDRRKFDI